MSARVQVKAWRSGHPGERITDQLLRDLLGLDTLRGANLGGANLRGADLRDANLWGADLRDANRWGADLRDAIGGVLRIDGLPSGQVTMVPTCDGWRITIGCWTEHSLADLAALIADEDEWPEATGAERERRRPLLAAVLALAEAHATYHADALAAVAHWAEVTP
jgi:hypothetical protein